MNLQEKWGKTLHREAGITIPAMMGGNISFDDVMYNGFSVPLHTHLDTAMARLGWKFVVSTEGYGVTGERPFSDGVHEIEVHLSTDLKTVNVNYDGVGEATIPFLRMSGQPYLRLFAQVVAKIPAEAFQPVK